MPARTPAHPVFDQEVYQADVPVQVDFTVTWLHRCRRTQWDKVGARSWSQGTAVQPAQGAPGGGLPGGSERATPNALSPTDTQPERAECSERTPSHPPNERERHLGDLPPEPRQRAGASSARSDAVS